MERLEAAAAEAQATAEHERAEKAAALEREAAAVAEIERLRQLLGAKLAD